MTGAGTEANKALFLEKVRQSNSACQAGDFDTAISLYSEAIAMDRNNVGRETFTSCLCPVYPA